MLIMLIIVKKTACLVLLWLLDIDAFDCPMRFDLHEHTVGERYMLIRMVLLENRVIFWNKDWTKIIHSLFFHTHMGSIFMQLQQLAFSPAIYNLSIKKDVTENIQILDWKYGQILLFLWIKCSGMRPLCCVFNCFVLNIFLFYNL